MTVDYQLAVLVLAATLGIKTVVITLVTVRCRIVSGQMRPIPEDNNVVLQFLLNYVFKLLLVVCPLGPDNPAVPEGAKKLLAGTDGDGTVSDPRLDAWLGAHRNASEHEPWFMAMAVMYSFAGGSIVSWAPMLIYVYLGARVLHMLSYVCGLQPWRTLTFLTALFIQLGLGCLMFFADFSSETWKAPYILVAGLGVKIVVLTLMTVRCRIVSGQMRPIPEDDNAVLKCLINYVFKVLLVVCPLGPNKKDSEEEFPNGKDTDPSLLAWQGSHRNATEHEPWFMAMAIASISLSNSMPSFTPVLMYVYLAARVLHMLCYVCGLQPWRTLTFVTGVFTQLGLGVFLLISLQDAADDSWKALYILTAALGIKIVIITLLTVRCRIVSGLMRPIPEDDNAAVRCLINYVFKLLLLVFPLGPDRHPDLEESKKPERPVGDTDPRLVAWLDSHRNATEQEPWFVIMALVAVMSPGVPLGTPSGTAEVALLYTYLAGRVLHMLSYVCGLQPWRTLTFVVALFAQLTLGVLMLMQIQEG